MSKIEIVLLIAAILTPFVSLLFVHPKKRRRKKIISEPAKPEEPVKIDYQKPIEFKEPEQTPELNLPDNEASNDDFKAYLEKKNRVVSGSKEFNRFEDFYRLDRFGDRKRANSVKTPNGNIADMDERTKAILIANVLSRKYFD